MDRLLYFVISILATTIGSTTGMGGGVIIKPVLDILGDYDVATIGMLSSISVLTMSFVSVGKQIYSKAKFDTKTVIPLASGAVVGGILGNYLLELTIKGQSSNYVTIIQNVILAILILIIFIYMINKHRAPSLGLSGIGISIAMGLLLGSVSSFLGIGGGPINVAIFVFVFAFDTKTSVLCSLVTIIFSQLSKLITVMFTTGFKKYDLSILPYMLVGAVLGGIIGAEINKKISDEKVVVLFNVAQVLIFGICVVNVFRGIASY